MKLWTLQSKGFWKESKEKGILRTDGRYADRDFRSQYNWLREQMKKRVPGYKGRFPIWAYPEKPDMRRRWWGAGGVEMYRVEFDAPDEKVLVSDYDLWFVPLNNGYLPTDEKDGEEFDKVEQEIMTQHTGTERWISRWDLSPEDFGDNWQGWEDYEGLRSTVWDSWERIFPNRWDELDQNYMGTPGECLQAVVEEVPMEWVKNEKLYTLQHDEFELEAIKDGRHIVEDHYDKYGNLSGRSYRLKRQYTVLGGPPE